MTSQVFFSDIKSVDKLFDALDCKSIITPNDSVALKIHFGEPGNNAYLKPDEVKPICEKIKSLGGKPFYTDCNTLYKGPRSTTKDHLKVAVDHGYTEASAGAIAVIPEENDSIAIDVNLKHFKKVFLGAPALKSDSIIALTHFKGHEMTGFGGAIKNLGMGLATRVGKLRSHQDCANCPEAKTCKRNQTIESCWFGSPTLVQEKIVEYAYGAVKGRKQAYFNYLIRISPQCDCYGFNDAPIIQDIGILASFDPVAIDQASVDLVNQKAGKDIIKEIHPNVDWEVQLKYAEEIGLGNRKYELIR